MTRSIPKYIQPLQSDQSPRQGELVAQGKAQIVALEPIVWQSLADIATTAGTTVDTLCDRIDRLRGDQGFEDSINLFVLHYYRLVVTAGDPRRSWGRGWEDAPDDVDDDAADVPFDIDDALDEWPGGRNSTPSSLSASQYGGAMTANLAIEQALEILYRPDATDLL